MHFYELVNARVSIRGYTSQPVEEAAIRRILEAARLAPSAANRQPWHIYVVRDEAARRRLFPDERQAWIVGAPVILVLCMAPGQAWVRGVDEKNHADVDAGIIMEHLVLAATEEGLGTCWVCAFDPTVFREALALPDALEPVAATPLGHADAAPRPRSRKALEEITTWI